MSNFDCFVEATITALRFERETGEFRIEASCVWGNKEKRAFIASKVDDLLVSDLRTYNVIDRVNFFAAEDAKEEINDCTSCLFFLMQQRELSTSDLQWPPFREKLASIRSGKLLLIEIEPVVGAAILIMAERVGVELILGSGAQLT